MLIRRCSTGPDSSSASTSTKSGTEMWRRAPESSARDLTFTRVIDRTLAAGPTQRITYSYRMPICIELKPLRSRLWRQCSGDSRSMKPVCAATSTDRMSPR